MRARSVVKWFVALVALASAPTAADAQNQPSPSGTGTVPTSQNVQLSPDQMAIQGNADVSAARSAAKGVQDQLQKARQDGDVVKTLCLSDVLSQMDAAVNSMQERLATLGSDAQQANAAGPNGGAQYTEAANHEYTILTVLNQRIDQLKTQAGQCLGKDTATTEGTTVNATTDDNMPPPTETPPWSQILNPPPPPALPPGIVEPPPPCSPEK